MASTSRILKNVGANLDESIGLRRTPVDTPINPVASAKDVGRRRLQNVGSVEIDRVTPDPEQPRRDFSEDAIRRLAASIQANGQLMPIHVRWSHQLLKWVIISGERRWRAAKAAGLSRVDCCFADGELSESQRLEHQLVENLLRENLRPVEEARAFQALMTLNGWTGLQAAAALNVPASKVSRALALLDLPVDIQDKVDSGTLPARSAYEVSRLPDDEARRELAAKVVSTRMTTAETANEVRQHNKARKKKRKPDGIRQEFRCDNGWRLVATSKHASNYHELEQAVLQVLEEVRARIHGRVKLL